MTALKEQLHMASITMRIRHQTNHLRKPSAIRSLVMILDWGAGKTETFSCCNHDGYDGSIREGVGLLFGARALIGHNIISFESQHINRLQSISLDKTKMFDN